MIQPQQRKLLSLTFLCSCRFREEEHFRLHMVHVSLRRALPVKKKRSKLKYQWPNLGQDHKATPLWWHCHCGADFFHEFTSGLSAPHPPSPTHIPFPDHNGWNIKARVYFTFIFGSRVCLLPYIIAVNVKSRRSGKMSFPRTQRSAITQHK